MKRQTAEIGTQTDPELYPEQFEEEKKETRAGRRKRDLPATPYISARIDADDMRTMYQTDRAFVVGDEKVSHPYTRGISLPQWRSLISRCPSLPFSHPSSRSIQKAPTCHTRSCQPATFHAISHSRRLICCVWARPQNAYLRLPRRLTNWPDLRLEGLLIAEWTGLFMAGRVSFEHPLLIASSVPPHATLKNLLMSNCLPAVPLIIFFYFRAIMASQTIL